MIFRQVSFAQQTHFLSKNLFDELFRLRRQYVPNLLPHGFGNGIANQFFYCRTHILEAQFQVEHEDDIRCVFCNHPVFFLTLPQQLHGFDALSLKSVFGHDFVDGERQTFHVFLDDVVLGSAPHARNSYFFIF